MLKFLRKVFVFISVAFFLLTLTNLALSTMDRTQRDETYKELELFADALAYVQTQYADQTQPKDLMYGALGGMINGLDPHSSFLTPQEYEDLKVETEGKFGGIGVEITIKDDLVTVITPIEDTPAWELGIQTGDRIVKIDDAVIKDLTLSEVVKKLRGKPGTEVAIVIWREKESKLLPFKIKRAMIEVKDIKEAKILEGGIGYIRLVEFRDDTPQELDRALKALKEKGMDSLVFDLRNNPGGLLDKAVNVAERFLSKGTPIVSVKGRDPKQDIDFIAGFGFAEADMPIVLLVNGGSASGSEIVAGAFQDNKRAIILGEKSFGKGSVQSVIPLRDGSALKLTTSRYITPKGHIIHDKGVTPDIVVVRQEPQTEEALDEKAKAEKELARIFEGAEEPKPDEEQAALQKLYGKDAQLSRAVDLLKSIKIYKSFEAPSK